MIPLEIDLKIAYHRGKVLSFSIELSNEILNPVRDDKAKNSG